MEVVFNKMLRLDELKDTISDKALATDRYEGFELILNTMNFLFSVITFPLFHTCCQKQNSKSSDVKCNPAHLMKAVLFL